MTRGPMWVASPSSQGTFILNISPTLRRFLPLAANFRHVNNYRTLRQWILSGTFHADPSGTTYQEGQSTGVVEGATLTYTYDNLGQLEGFDYPSDPANWSSKVNLDYTYDALGWLKKRDNDGTGRPMNEYMELSGQSLVKKVEYRYCRTCAGNRTERIETDEYGEIIEWLRYEMEDLNHLRIDEMYDSPSDGNSVLDDEDPFRVQRVYYNGPGQLGQIAKVKVWDYSGQNPTSTDYYYGYDILGNVSVISNSNGAEADQFEQDAFGNEVESSWSSPIGGITEHLTTKQYDADLGLYYFSARWYDQVLGRFICTDPYHGTRFFPQSSAVYTIALNCPMSLVDPSGASPLDFKSCVEALTGLMRAGTQENGTSYPSRFGKSAAECEKFVRRVEKGEWPSPDLWCKCSDHCGANTEHCRYCCVMRHSDWCRRSILLSNKMLDDKWKDFDASTDLEFKVMKCVTKFSPSKLAQKAMDEFVQALFGKLIDDLWKCELTVSINGKQQPCEFPEEKYSGDLP